MAIQLAVPNVGESITEVQIGEWLKAEGDPVRKDENVVTLESEKATMELPAPADGVLGRIFKQRGETAKVGDVIAEFEPSDKAPPAAGGAADAAQESANGRHERKPAREATAGRRKERETGPTRAASAAEERGAATGSREAERDRGEPRVMPAAEKLLAEHGLRAAEVKATGPGGRLLKEDVLRHVATARSGTAGDGESGPAAAAAPERAAGRETEVVPMSPLRRTVARRLVEAQQTMAMLTTFNEIDLSAVIALRQQQQEAFQRQHGVKLGFMSFFVKAVIDALKLVPQLNAEVRGNDIVYHHYHDIGVAIGGGRGLVVPVLRDADRLSFAEVEKAIADFAQRAQENKLALQELQGGTFTISNGGVYGSLLSTPIINPPQSGILGMHTIQDRPVAIAGQVVIRPMMFVALTYDHRIVDGREAVTFLRRVKDVIENPARMLIEV